MEPGRIIESIKDHAAHGMFSFCGYGLSRNEAETVVVALAEHTENHKEEKHGDETSLWQDHQVPRSHRGARR